MPQLYLLRHAKAVAFASGLDDHQRPLAERGRNQAAAVGEYLRESAVTIDQVLCSTSTRTRETLAGLAVDAPVEFSDAFYHATADDLRSRLAALSDNGSVLLIGHNPAVADLARDLAGPDPEPSASALVHDRFPTAALAEVAIDSWPDLAGQLPTGCRLTTARFT